MELGSTVSAVRSQRVLLGDEIRPAVILIKDGKIHQILSDISVDVPCEVSTFVDGMVHLCLYIMEAPHNVFTLMSPCL